jgi:hypothetical protein
MLYARGQICSRSSMPSSYVVHPVSPDRRVLLDRQLSEHAVGAKLG